MSSASSVPTQGNAHNATAIIAAAREDNAAGTIPADTAVPPQLPPFDPHPSLDATLQPAGTSNTLTATAALPSITPSHQPPNPNTNQATTRINEAIEKNAYRDYSRVTPSQLSEYVEGEKNRKPTFPRKLQSILAHKEYEDTIVWLPHGRAWRVLSNENLEKEVLPKFFRHNSRASFLRQVNNWGFKRIGSGRDDGAYYHELFLRGLPHVCLLMHGTKTKIGGKEQGSKKMYKMFDVAPNFYDISEIRPLPPAGGSGDPVPLNVLNFGTEKEEVPIVNPTATATATEGVQPVQPPQPAPTHEGVVPLLPAMPATIAENKDSASLSLPSHLPQQAIPANNALHAPNQHINFVGNFSANPFGTFALNPPTQPNASIPYYMVPGFLNLGLPQTNAPPVALANTAFNPVNQIVGANQFCYYPFNPLLGQMGIAPTQQVFQPPPTTTIANNPLNNAANNGVATNNVANNQPVPAPSFPIDPNVLNLMQNMQQADPNVLNLMQNMQHADPNVLCLMQNALNSTMPSITAATNEATANGSCTTTADQSLQEEAATL